MIGSLSKGILPVEFEPIMFEVILNHRPSEQSYGGLIALSYSLL